MNFKCFLGIDRLEGSVYKRVFSKQHLGGSKVFEEKMQKYVASVARKYYDIIDDNMTESEILAQIYLDHYGDELSLKGDLLVKINDHVIDLSLYPYGTVLNKLPYEKGTLVLFSHGYFSPGERRVLAELVSVLSEDEVRFYHTGDLDYGGIRIFEFIRNQIFPRLKPLNMNVETWEKYSRYGYGLEPSKQEKLKAMLDEGKIQEQDLQKLAQVIYNTGIGIEQESFLFTE